jgi:hypothetical protein
LAKSKLVKGKVYNGSTWTKETGEVENWEEGMVIEDPTTAKEVLPVIPGCFLVIMMKIQPMTNGISEILKKPVRY